MKFIEFLLRKIKNITILSIIMIVFLLLVNFISNGFVVEKISVLQEKEAINSGLCNYEFHLINETIILNKFTPIVDPKTPPERRTNPILKSTFFFRQ